MKIIYKNWLKVSSVATLLAISSGCRQDSVQTLPERNWQLVWSDEFDGAPDSSPDSSKWKFDIGNGDSGWGNQELEYYTNRPSNISLDGNGHLIITARKESYNGFAYTSGRIKTEGLFEQTYGRIEARLKTPYGPGIWPAFWTLGSNASTVGWPNVEK